MDEHNTKVQVCVFEKLNLFLSIWYQLEITKYKPRWKLNTFLLVSHLCSYSNSQNHTYKYRDWDRESTCLNSLTFWLSLFYLQAVERKQLKFCFCSQEKKQNKTRNTTFGHKVGWDTLGKDRGPHSFAIFYINWYMFKCIMPYFVPQLYTIFMTDQIKNSIQERLYSATELQSAEASAIINQ